MLPSYPRRIALLISAVSACSVGIALLTQHLWGMQPCPWCIAQRFAFVCMAIVGGLAAASDKVARAGLWLVSALGVFGAGLALWQHFVAAQSTSCAFTAADRFINATGLDQLLPAVFEPKASCADAAVSLLGVPYEAWSFALFVVLAGLAAKAALHRSRG